MLQTEDFSHHISVRIIAGMEFPIPCSSQYQGNTSVHKKVHIKSHRTDSTASQIDN